MMRFIEPIVPGIQVHRHNRYVSIPDTVERRYSIDFQFLDGVALVCAHTSPGYVCWKGPVSIYASPAVSRDTLDVLYLSIQTGSAAAIFAPFFFVDFLSLYTLQSRHFPSDIN